MEIINPMCDDMKLFVLKNIKNLLSESEFLFINKSYARSIFLILVALEEMGRVILLEKKRKILINTIIVLK